MAAKPPRQPMSLIHTLQIAAQNLTHDMLQEVVVVALGNSPAVVDVFKKLLLVPEGEVVVEGDESENGDEDGHEDGDDNEERDEKDESNGTAVSSIKANPSHKRSLSAYADIPTQPHHKKTSTTENLVPRYALCKNCKEDFNVTHNCYDACNYHDGVLEVDYEHETWIDWDENCHGRISEMEEEYPEGFMWECCERDGNARGCQRGWHQM